MSVLRWIALCCLVAGSVSADTIRLAVTTSFENSGLSDVLLPVARDATGDSYQLIVVGTGKALRLGAAGDVDAVLVHAPDAERAAVKAGHFTHRREIMFNDFVLVGPRDDPAGIARAAGAADALTRISAQNALFASRGDESGTHKAELALWEVAGIDVAAASPRWYRATGAGMGATLNAAVAMGAYALSDRASWLTFGNPGNHALLFEGDTALFNQYALLPVDPARHPHVAAEAVARFEAWLTGPVGQGVINDYRLAGQPLFTANATPR
ncbi:MAG: substrate-binding domain-containing protein [Pseudomonadota bacterium]